MVLFEWLNHIDTQLLLALNACNNTFFDHFFSLFTAKETWYPLYLFIVFIIFRKYKINGLWLVLIIILAVVVSDQLSGFFKDFIHRPRPSHQPLLDGKLNLPTGKGGSFGFFSGHATNSFALAFILGFLTKSKRMWFSFITWALLTSCSRVYVGVHYPFDVVTGAIVGSLIGWGAFKFIMFFDSRFLLKRIVNAGKWESVHSNLLLVALCFITVTLLVVAKPIGV